MNEYLLDSPVLSRILIPYIYTGLQRLSPPRGAGWELRAYRTIPRAEQGHRWSCRWGRGGTLGLVPLVVEVAGRDRTEDYQQSRYQNHRTYALPQPNRSGIHYYFSSRCLAHDRRRDNDR